MTRFGRSRVAASLSVVLAGIGLAAFGQTQRTVTDRVTWTPPIGIPAPPFGIAQEAPRAPSPWRSATPRFYYVNASAPGATDAGNEFGWPEHPRATIPLQLPAGAVVELHGQYEFAHSSPRGIVARGTQADPVFIRGTGPNDRPDILQGWEVSGTYLVMEHLRFRAKNKAQTGSIAIVAPVKGVALRDSDVSGNLNSGGLGIEGWDGRSTASDVLIWRNTVHDNGNVKADFDQDRHGIHVGTRVNNVWVLDNEMWANSGDGIQISARFKADQAQTHHIYVGRNRSHHNKQYGFWTKQAVDVIFSQNVAYAHRPGNSSAGAGLGFQYAPDYVWFLFNHVYDSDFGIATGSDSGLGTGTESFFIGNLIHDIHDTDGDFKPLTAWHNCGISLPGGVNRYVVNNTLVNVDSGVCLPSPDGKVEIHNNIVYGVRSDGQHVFLEFPKSTAASKAGGNVFGPVYRALTAGKQQFVKQPRIGKKGENALVESIGFAALASPYDLGPGSRAIDFGVDDPAGVYALFQKRYRLDIRRDFAGRRRPYGAGYDAGAFEFTNESSP